MNTIAARLNTTKYINSPHLDFFVDGQELGQLLDERHPGHQISGMIPTTLNWMEFESEQLIVWNRFLDRNSAQLTIPILCCPDERDFTCSLIIVDAEISNRIVKWNRFGFDMTESDYLPIRVGSTVNWFAESDSLIFDRDEYDKMTHEFEAWSRTQVAG